ncbi:hypothetical protein KKA33_03060 [Patescibacteria group bacterium]|nr:hypothetical protein [Patescibacteria group bacterium]
MKKIILVPILIVILSLTGCSNKSDVKQGMDLVEATIKCEELLEKKQEKYFGSEIGQMKTTFNTDLNTCLVFNIYNNSSAGHYYGMVKDLVSDKTLLYYSSDTQGPYFRDGESIDCEHQFDNLEYLDGDKKKEEYGCERYDLMEKMFEIIQSYGFEVLGGGLM